MSVAIAKWTLDDYHCMIDSGILAGRSVELLDGVIVEMSPEGEAHAYLTGVLSPLAFPTLQLSVQCLLEGS